MSLGVRFNSAVAEKKYANMASGSSATNHALCWYCHSTMVESCIEPEKSTTASSERESGISYEIIIAIVRIAPSSA